MTLRIQMIELMQLLACLVFHGGNWHSICTVGYIEWAIQRSGKQRNSTVAFLFFGWGKDWNYYLLSPWLYSIMFYFLVTRHSIYLFTSYHITVFFFVVVLFLIFNFRKLWSWKRKNPQTLLPHSLLDHSLEPEWIRSSSANLWEIWQII